MNKFITASKKKYGTLYRITIISLMLIMIGMSYKITYKKTAIQKIEYRISATKIKTFADNNNKNYYIKVNYLSNTITIYEKREEGLVPIKAMICSCGISTPTEGIYNTSDKYRWQELFGNTYGQYCTRIVGHILFHSVPYMQNNNPATLIGQEYDKLGEKASAGCIRLKVEDAKWIYENCKEDTEVEFYADENPGPLGKPKIFKISNYKYCNWDPTDEDKNNPWPRYINEIKEEIKKDVKESENITGSIGKNKSKVINGYYKEMSIKVVSNIEDSEYISTIINNLKKQYTSI